MVAEIAELVRFDFVFLGFKLEGIIQEIEWLHDHFADHAIYGLLQSDFAKGNLEANRQSPQMQSLVEAVA